MDDLYRLAQSIESSVSTVKNDMDGRLTRMENQLTSIEHKVDDLLIRIQKMQNGEEPE